MRFKEMNDILKRISRDDSIVTKSGDKLNENPDFILLKWHILNKQPLDYFRAGITFLEKPAGVLGKIGIKPLDQDWFIVMTKSGSPRKSIPHKEGKCRTVTLLQQDDVELLGSNKLFVPCDWMGRLFEDNISEYVVRLLESITFHNYIFSGANIRLEDSFRNILIYYSDTKRLMDYSKELEDGYSVKRLKNGMTLKLSNESPRYFMKKDRGSNSFSRYEISFDDLSFKDWVLLEEK